MSNSGRGPSRWAYPGTLALLVLAVLFPMGLMVFNPTLMFERGWEQFVGTGIYFWAVLTLTRELALLWKNEHAFDEAPALLREVLAIIGRPSGAPGAAAPSRISESDARLLPARLRQLVRYLGETRSPSSAQLMELNREGSALDQEHHAGRFTLPRYILYLLPVIGFIGTVEGISKALMNISKVLPMVKELDGFMSNLTGVTSALQIAFDSTLLALFLSAALMLVQTLVFRRSEDLLARVDRWVVDEILPRVGGGDPVSDGIAGVLGQQIERFSAAVDRLPASLASFQRGADAIGRLGGEIESLVASGAALQKGVASLARIESALATRSVPDPRLDAIRSDLDRACQAIESLSESWSQAYERSSRATQDQLARTLGSLKEALEMLNVSMEQSNALYRSIVKKMIPTYHTIRPDEEAA